MAIPIVEAGRQQAKRFVGYQLSLVIVAALLALTLGKLVALAILIGGLVVILPGLLFIGIAFRRSGAKASKQVVKAFYLGEALKMLLSAVLVVIALMLLSGVEIYVLAGYILALLSQWLLPLVVKTQ